MVEAPGSGRGKNVSSDNSVVRSGLMGRGINEKGANGFRNRDVWEEMGPGSIAASRWVIGWVKLTWDVLSMDLKASRRELINLWIRLKQLLASRLR